MGHKNKQKNGSLTYQIEKGLVGKLATGQSKHQAKGDGSYKNNIYSYNTLNTYMRELNKFADYCKQEHSCKTMEQCSKYCNEYIAKAKNDGKSAYTQHTIVAAFSKYYGNTAKDYIKTDDRNRVNCTRSRTECQNSKHFSETKNADLVSFCKSTGLRRNELEYIKGNQLVKRNDDYYIHIIGSQAKGGRDRYAKVIGTDEQIQLVVNKMNSSPDERVWGSVNVHADIHGYRADYAYNYYMDIARDTDTLDTSEKYICRSDLSGLVLDREAMQEVSVSLGHNRVDVVVNYLGRYF